MIIVLRVSLHQAYVSLCDFASSKNYDIAIGWGHNLFSSDSIFSNENKFASITITLPYHSRRCSV